METIEVSKLANDWLTSHVMREKSISYYYIKSYYNVYNRRDEDMRGVAPNTPFWLLNKRHMSDSFKKNKTRQIAFTSVYAYTYNMYYYYIYVPTNISSDRIYAFRNTNRTAAARTN